jgi:hypothetical protein
MLFPHTKSSPEEIEELLSNIKESLRLSLVASERVDKKKSSSFNTRHSMLHPFKMGNDREEFQNSFKRDPKDNL